MLPSFFAMAPRDCEAIACAVKRKLAHRRLNPELIGSRQATAHRSGLLLLLLLVACSCNTSSQSHVASPSSTSTRIAGALPTPTDYRSVCDLEASVCSCVGVYQSSFCSQSLPAGLMRPLRLPSVAPGQACPTTIAHPVTTADFGGNALGDGKVEALIAGDPNKLSAWPNGWFGIKTIWFALPSYSDAVLVRAARIDGTGAVGFGEQPAIGHLIIPPGPTMNGTGGYREAPGGTFVKDSGCYAWQVDGVGFTYVIVFKAVVPTAAPSPS